MTREVPTSIPRDPLVRFLTALADDELVLGHRNSEWVGHAPILEEDIAWANIAQDEIGHSLAWFTLNEELTGVHPDRMGFERQWKDFTCCRFVAYPKGDFAYTVVRQYLFDAAEQVRLEALRTSSFAPIRELSEKMLKEEAYHLLHTQGLVERLGNATEESHRRMQAAVNQAFPQALGVFEKTSGEDELVSAGVFVGHGPLQTEWLASVVPVLRKASLDVPVSNGSYEVLCSADKGGRQGKHTEHLQEIVESLHLVYREAPGKW